MARTSGMTSKARLLSRPSRLVMWLGVALGLAFFLLFGIAPAVANIVISLTDYSGLAGASTSFTGLDNYTTLFTTQWPGFVASLGDSLYFVVGVTVVQNAIALALAHRLQGTSRSAALLRILAFLPIVLGVTVVGIVWLLLFDPQSGPIQAIVGHAGIHSAFFGSGSLAMPLTIGVQVWQNLGFTMVVFIGGLKAIPAEIFEAAAIDGVTGWQRFRRLTWPLLAPVVTVNVTFAVIGSLTTYNLIYILTDGQFGTNTLGILAFNTAFGNTADLGLGASMSVILLLLAIIVALPLVAFLQHRERRLLA
jgi:raffinose/stachyose/melibiose transport system permease protein